MNGNSKFIIRFQAMHASDANGIVFPKKSTLQQKHPLPQIIPVYGPVSAQREGAEVNYENFRVKVDHLRVENLVRYCLNEEMSLKFE